MTAVVLPRVIPAPVGKPERPGAADTQRRALQVTLDPSSWDDRAASATARHFDELAAIWDDERASYRPAPLSDALARGGPWLTGRCIELGSGTSVLTPLLAAQWSDTPVRRCFGRHARSFSLAGKDPSRRRPTSPPYG